MKLALLLVAAYLLGSIPFGFLVGRTRGVDVTKHGSGNIGFSNVLRLLGLGPASVVLVADVLKGAIPVCFGRVWLPSITESDPALWLPAVAVAPILGHTFSVFLRFRGGRAVATTLGALLGMNWLAGRPSGFSSRASLATSPSLPSSPPLPSPSSWHSPASESNGLSSGPPSPPSSSSAISRTSAASSRAPSRR